MSELGGKTLLFTNAVALAALACGSPFTPQGVAGTYKRVGSVANVMDPDTPFLPGTRSFPPVLTLRADGTYAWSSSEISPITSTCENVADVTIPATYELREPNTIVGTSQCSGSFWGEWDDGVLSIFGGDRTFIYERVPVTSDVVLP